MFYVYAHTKKNGEIFYIGKGRDRRAWSSKDRNKRWHEIVSEHGINPTILADDLTEDQAYKEETALIQHFKKFGCLCNQTDGGNGSRGLSHNEEFKAKRRSYMLSDLNPMLRDDVRRQVSERMKSTPHHMRKPENSIKVSGCKNGMYGRSGKSNPVSIPVTIDGVRYESIRLASIALGVDYLPLYRSVRKYK